MKPVSILTAVYSIFNAPAVAYAEIPVVDMTANASLVSQISNQLEMISNLATQVSSLASLVSLAQVASTALGDTVSPELGQMFSDATTAYNRSNQAYGSIMAVPDNVDRELALFSPPPAGWGSMTTPQLIDRANRIRKLTADTSAAAVSRQAADVEMRAERAMAAARANGMADRSISALSATQAVAQQMRVAGDNLNHIEQSNADILTIIALRADKERSDHEITSTMAQTDIKKMQQELSGGMPQLAYQPSSWRR